jgi:hypothetical protein
METIMADLISLYRGPMAQANDLLPARMHSRAADVISLAMGYQETKFATRQQYGGGPGHGYHQFERPSVRRIMIHPRAKAPLQDICQKLDQPFTDASIYVGLLTDDVLDFALARLLMWTDAASLPQIGDEAGAWSFYIRVWNPGKPRPSDWHESYDKALRAVSGAA